MRAPGTGWTSCARSVPASSVATAGAIDGLWYSIVALLLTRPRALAKLQQHGLLLDRVFGALLLALAVYILASVLLTV